MDANDSTVVIDIINLKKWQNEKKIKTLYTVKSSSNPSFPFSTVLNEKIAIWNGSIYKLQSDAIVIPINNFIDGKLSIETSKIYKLAGSNYARSFINCVLGCKTSEIRVTDGHDLPCHHVLHTVVPRYNPKYESAAINAIYNCYRNSLLTAIDMGIRKIGFAILHLSKQSFPNDIAIHITARTIRRFLEKYSDSIDIIALQVSDELIDIYNEILPIYFPRNSNEEEYSIQHTPDDLGNEDGQPILPNREIRITAFPYGPGKKFNHDDNSEEEYDSDNDITSLSRRTLAQTHIPPAVLRQSLTLKSQGKVVEAMQNYEGNMAINRRFDRLLRESKKMDTSHLLELRVFYQCGKDINGFPIFLVVGKHIPYNVEEIKNEVLSFIVHILEKNIKGKHFSIIYAHTESNYRPPRSFFTEVYELLRIKYERLMQCICMVHPTLIDRSLNWILTTFYVPQLKSKMYNVTNLRQLYRLVNPSLLELPDFIYQYDKQVGGSNKLINNTPSNPGEARLSVASVVHEEL